MGVLLSSSWPERRGIRIVAKLNDASVWWHIGTVLVISARSS